MVSKRSQKMAVLIWILVLYFIVILDLNYLVITNGFEGTILRGVVNHVATVSKFVH